MAACRHRVLCSLAVVGCSAVAASAAAAATAPHFVAGALPFPGGTATNDAEPGIAASGNGTFIIGATSPGRGSDLWISRDGGQTYSWQADPFQAPPEGLNPENGQDTDVAAAPLANGTGPPNLYATSLYIADSALAVSRDGGQTFSLNPFGGTPSQDRPWLAADGSCTVYLAYQNGDSGPPSKEMVSRFDACAASPTQTGSGAVLNPVQSPTDPYPLGAFLGGKPMVDNSPHSPFQHNLYIPMGGCENDVPGPMFVPSANPFDCQFARATLSIAVSSDGGKSFVVRRVADSTTHELQIWPDQLAVDAGGEIYLVWSDNHRVYLNTSTDGGSTWSGTHAVNAPPARSAVFPTVAAGAPGHVDIAWYGATRDGMSNDVQLMGDPGAPGAAAWQVYFAKSTDGGRSFVQAGVTPTIHTGIVCTSANACATTHSRDLFEDFGIAISSATQRASMAYTIDEFTTLPQTQSTDYLRVGYATELATATQRPRPGHQRRRRGSPKRHHRARRGHRTLPGFTG